MTYAIGNNKNHRLGISEGDNVISWPRKVEILCNKNIKKFTYGYYMFALTEEGEVCSKIIKLKLYKCFYSRLYISIKF